MLTSPQYEKIYLAYIKAERCYSLINSSFFEDEEIQKFYKVDKAFFLKYKQPASHEQITKYFYGLPEEKRISEGLIESILDVRLDDYDVAWLEESFRTWAKVRNMQENLLKLSSYVKTTSIDSSNIDNVIDTVQNLVLGTNINFDDDLGLNFYSAAAHQPVPADTFSSGYPFIDECLGGGYEKKTLVCLAGLPKSGKSWWLTNLGCNCVRAGHNTVVVSLEMSEKRFLKRFASNLLSIPLSEYEAYGADVTSIERRLTDFRQHLDIDNLQPPGDLYIKSFPTGGASVLDLEAYLKKAEERNGKKFKVVIIDYINIIKNYRNPNTENLYIKIKQIAEDLRGMAVRNEWSVITATQLNRQSISDSELTIEHISESMGLVHTVDALFGIIKKYDTQHYYYLKALALRNGGSEVADAKKRFSIDNDYMIFSETLEERSNGMIQL